MEKTLRQELKRNTMACWWPSKITGKTVPDWQGIAGELAAARDTAAAYGRVADVQILNGLLRDLRSTILGNS